MASELAVQFVRQEIRNFYGADALFLAHLDCFGNLGELVCKEGSDVSADPQHVVVHAHHSSCQASVEIVDQVTKKEYVSDIPCPNQHWLTFRTV